MGRQITLEEALYVWEEQGGSEQDQDRCMPVSDLYGLLLHRRTPEINKSLLVHLSRCPQCIRRLRDMAKAVEEAGAWDVALPKAASSDDIQWSKEIPTEGRKYTIVIRRSISDTNKGVITIQAEPAYRDAVEGSIVILRDGGGRVLLQGAIVDGEVSQAISGLDTIIPRFFVEPVQRPQ
jgi:hypothetical protein